MSIRGTVLLFLLSSVFLILLFLYLFAKPLHLQQLERERIANIQKVCMKAYPRNRKRVTLQRNIDEAEDKLQQFLGERPIDFDAASIVIKDKVALRVLIDILNNINESVVLAITTHTDMDGSPSQNIKLSQERADVLKEYIRERTQILLITAIGYGEEFPLPETTDSTTNRRVEMHLIRIKK